jgi:hypothetical protein
MTHRSSLNRTGLIAAAAALIGVMLPWVSAPVLSRSGISTSDGKVIAVLAMVALIVGLIVVRPRRIGVVYLVCGGVGAAAAIGNLAQISRALRPGGLSMLISPGGGLYLDVAALVVLAVTGLLLIARRA